MDSHEKRKFSSKLGLVVVVGFFLLIVVVKGGIWAKHRGDIRITNKVLYDTCEGIAFGNKYLLQKWAGGEFVDAWGNQILLESDDGKTVVCVSKGPDGMLGTPDDIRMEKPVSNGRPAAQRGGKL